MYSKNAPFRYDFVGSFLRPAPIKAARAAFAAGELDAADLEGDSRQACHENDTGQGLVAVFAVIHLGVHQDAQAGGADHTVKQEGDSADHRPGNGLD